MNQSPENTLVLACTNMQHTKIIQVKISRLIQNGLDWQQVLSCAKSQGVASLVYYNLSKLSCKQAIPPTILFKLKKQYLDTIGRNIIVFAELKKALMLLQQAEIEVAVLKGPALIATVYKDWGLRWIGDIDLLVSEDDLFKAQDCLLNHGYIQDKQMERPKKIEFRNHLIGMRSAQNSIQIEIHWTLNINQIFNLNMNSILNRAENCTIDDMSFLVLSPEDMLLHLCLHHCHSHIHDIKYKSMFDIVAFIQQYSASICWERFVNYNIHYKTITPSYIGLNLARQLFSIDIPSYVVESLQNKCNNTQSFHFNLLKDTNGTSVANLFLLNDMSSKMHYLKQIIFPSIEFLSFRYSVPVDSKFIYLLYFVRPVQLLKDHLAPAIKLLFMFVIQKIKNWGKSSKPELSSFLKKV